MGDCMIGYPNKKTAYKTSSEINYSRRGMSLEEDINDTNRYYLEADIAAVHKKPTPITIVNVDYKSRSTAKITEAYFQVPSTTDYNGVYRGQYLDFEAKETHNKTAFPLKIIHPHQLAHLSRVIKYGGIAFLIIRFVAHDETYLVWAKDLLDKIGTVKEKSIKYEWFRDNGILIPYNFAIKIDYLKVIDRLLDGGN